MSLGNATFASSVNAHNLCNNAGSSSTVAIAPNLVVEDFALIELKAVERILPVHEAQVLGYLKISGLPIGLLLNFNVPLLKDGIRRYVYTLPP